MDGLEWFHLPIEQRRPFPLPNIGVIAVAEHPYPFEDRIERARLFVGLCVWGRGQLEREIERETWRISFATPRICSRLLQLTCGPRSSSEPPDRAPRLDRTVRRGDPGPGLFALPGTGRWAPVTLDSQVSPARSGFDWPR